MQTSLLTSYSCAKQQFRGAGTSVILHDGRYGACPQAKTCYRHQQTSSSDLPNPRNILIWVGLCRRCPCRPCGSGGDWSKPVSWHPGVLYPTRPDVHTTSILHTWLQETDGSGVAVRVVLFDCRKTFDLINHTLLVRKGLGLSIPSAVALWVADFLTS